MIEFKTIINLINDHLPHTEECNSKYFSNRGDLDHLAVNAYCNCFKAVLKDEVSIMEFHSLRAVSKLQAELNNAYVVNLKLKEEITKLQIEIDTLRNRTLPCEIAPMFETISVESMNEITDAISSCADNDTVMDILTAITERKQKRVRPEPNALRDGRDGHLFKNTGWE